LHYSKVTAIKTLFLVHIDLRFQHNTFKSSNPAKNGKMQIASPFLENANLEPKSILHRRMLKEGNLSETKAIVK